MEVAIRNTNTNTKEDLDTPSLVGTRRGRVCVPGRFESEVGDSATFEDQTKSAKERGSVARAGYLYANKQAR